MLKKKTTTYLHFVMLVLQRYKRENKLYYLPFKKHQGNKVVPNTQADRIYICTFSIRMRTSCCDCFFERVKITLEKSHKNAGLLNAIQS